MFRTVVLIIILSTISCNSAPAEQPIPTSNVNCIHSYKIGQISEVGIEDGTYYYIRYLEFVKHRLPQGTEVRYYNGETCLQVSHNRCNGAKSYILSVNRYTDVRLWRK